MRVERLQEITEKDALREGVEPLIHEGYTGYDPRTQSYPFAFERNVLERELCIEIKHQRQELATAKGQYETLWNSLNAKRGYGWDKNPWVWVVAFRRTNV